jgi:SAM-dependent methyltransferase
MTLVQEVGAMPPQPLRERVSGSSDPNWFHGSGTLTISEWRRALASQDRTFSDFGTIVDFGCGCGRTLRHLIGLLSPHQQLVGLDPDAEAVRWVAGNLPGVQAFALSELPPAQNLLPNTADLILSHSVFTHLPEDVQLAWLSELARLLKPGGLLLASIHGLKVVEEYAQSLRNLGLDSSAAHFITEFNSRGFFHVVGKNEFEKVLPSYYGAAFHDVSYIQKNWETEFRLRAWLPTFALNHQDVLILERR